MKRYYDPEYDREISVEMMEMQYNWFVVVMHTTKSFEQFVAENFIEYEG